LALPPDTSDRSWLGALISLGGLLFGFVGVAALIWTNVIAVLGVATGAAIALSAAFWLQINRFADERRELKARIRGLEIDLADARRQAGEWSSTSSNVSTAVKSVLELVGAAPAAAPPRIPRARDEGEAEQ
jgi:hypothetical protein